ncbi:heparinase II/III family protein [Acinetobacter rudis]|uniref:heparinase II/III domain-containing protein n=1 Tax=Acinetobacter rudis TaxID=632955 RepID=UPI00280D6D54|nr:heparinase II/III family protein [Acinetobacter rudis]MDQ8954036.1 heparinase II/III family protein [Acinetobacter rudis]
MNFKTYLPIHFEPGYKSWSVIDDTIFVSPAKHKININDIDFQQPGNNASEIMWFYSLGWLAKYSESEKVEAQVLKFLSNYFKEVSSGNLDIIYKISSLDHCAASRIRYLCMIYARFHENQEITNIVRLLLIREVEWFSSLTGVACNNHGMMLCVSIFHAALVIGKGGILCELETAMLWLKGILDTVIPENGYVVENTIGYHDFYFKYIKNQLVFFDEYYHDLEVYDYLNGLFNKVELALYKVVMPNGNIPPLGQCGFYPTRYKSIPGTHLFKDQGFFVKKDNIDYFSLTCGYASPVHKQLDNTSITLSLSGNEIFIDSGLGTYNEKDSRSAVLNGQRGHSGAFFKALDNEYRHLFLSSNELKNVMSSIDIDGCSILSSFSFDFKQYKYSIERDINFINFKSFSIFDKFETNNDYGFPVSRFILPKDTSITINSNVISIDCENHLVSMTIGSSFNYSFKTGSDDFDKTEFASGWRSLSFGKFEKCNVIELYPINGNELSIMIDIKDK